jgi:hypothetical protein
MHVYVCVYVCVYMYICMYMYAYVYVHVYVYVYVSMYVYVDVCTCTCANLCICIYIYMYACLPTDAKFPQNTCIFIQTYTYIHIHIHIQAVSFDISSGRKGVLLSWDPATLIESHKYTQRALTYLWKKRSPFSRNCSSAFHDMKIKISLCGCCNSRMALNCGKL